MRYIFTLGISRIVKRAIILVCIILNFVCCNAQTDHCKVTTLGEFLSQLESIHELPKIKIRYSKYHSFNFEKFEPVKGTVLSNDFYEIGYSSSDSIVEIIHHKVLSNNHKIELKFIVYHFPQNRLLACQIADIDHSGFLPIIILMSKNEKSSLKNFMINLKPQFGTRGTGYVPGLVYSNVPIESSSIESISAIMALDDKLNAFQSLKLYNGYVMSQSIFEYDSENKLNHENLDIYFPIPGVSSYQINNATCFSDILSNNQKPELSFILHPKIDEGFEGLPLWIYGGAHKYVESAGNF